MTYCSTALCGLLQDDESWGPYVLSKKKKQDFYKRGKTWTALIKASLLTDTHLTFHSTVGREQMPIMMKCVMPWINKKHDTVAGIITTDYRCARRGGNTHSFIFTDALIHRHVDTNKGNNKGWNSTQRAFCYVKRMIQEPICGCFRWERAGVGYSNKSQVYLCLHHSCTDNNKTNTPKLRHKYPTWFKTQFCRLSVNIVSSRRGTPFIS